MVNIVPFSGLRFSPAHRLGRVLCPPYDVISAQAEQRYRALDGFNAVRVELGAASSAGGSDERYAQAAFTLRRWCDTGVLVRDDPPALYLHEARFRIGAAVRVRRELIAAVELHPWERGAVLAHERTRRRPKADRLRLLAATATNISPILSFFDRDGDGDRRAADPVAAAWTWAETAEPASEGTDLDGVSHRLWVLRHPSQHAALAGFFKSRPLYIADGHHRYETALQYREQRRVSERLPAAHPVDAVMMHLVAADDPGLVVLPTHRLLRALEGLDVSTVATRLSRELAVEATAVDPLRVEQTVPEVLERLAARGADRPAIAVYGPDPKTMLLAAPASAATLPASIPSDRHPAWRRLDAVLADALVIHPVLSANNVAAEEAVAYTHDPYEALARVRSGENRLAILLNPTPVDQIAAVAQAGERMPEKSTYFYPKAPTGLVFRPLN